MVSSGVRNLGTMLGGWAVALGLAAFTVTHFDEIRGALGLKLEPSDFGITAEAPAARGADPVDERTYQQAVEKKARELMAAREAAAQKDQARGGERAGNGNLFSQSVALQRSRDGHFRAEAEINGRSIRTLVDTGATLVAMSYEDAAAAGVSVSPGDFRYTSHTANGEARFARVTLDRVRIGNIVVRDVEAAVSEPGRLGVTLLGMSFLGQLRMEMRDGRLILEQ